MTLPYTLPDWVPWWVSLVVIVPAILLALAFLCMPFSVFGVKGRLEGVEARLDEIQGEIRSLALRLPERLERYERDPRAIERYERDPSMDMRYERGPSSATRYERDPPTSARHERDAAAEPRHERDPGNVEPGPRRWAEDDRPPIPPTAYARDTADRPPPSPSRRIEPSRGRTEPRIEPR